MWEKPGVLLLIFCFNPQKPKRTLGNFLETLFWENRMKMTHISSLKITGEKAGRKSSKVGRSVYTHRRVCVWEKVFLRYFSDNSCYCTVDLVIFLLIEYFRLSSCTVYFISHYFFHIHFISHCLLLNWHTNFIGISIHFAMIWVLN